MKKTLIPIAVVAILLVVLASVALVSAAPPIASRAAQAPSALEGVPWLLVSYQDKAGALVGALRDAPATAEFAAGRVTGTGGCNRFTASFEATNGDLTIGQAASTMMMCDETVMAQEMAVLTNLQAVAEYSGDGGQLTLFDALGAPLLVFVDEQPGTIVGSWVMTSFNNGRDGFESGLASPTVSATFDAEGRVSGNAGCNTFSAAYTIKDDQIEIGPAITTLMACAEDVMAQEAAFLKALEASTTFAIQGNELVLRDGTGAAQVGFIREAPAGATSALMGTAWRMTAFNNGRGGVQTALADVEVTATFGEDGMLSGSAGCNRYSASFEEDGDTLKIGVAISTMMACEQRISQQEAAYLKALANSTSFEINRNELILRDANGAVQLRFEQIAAEVAPAAPSAVATSSPVTGTTAITPTATMTATAPVTATVPVTGTTVSENAIPGTYLTLRLAASGGVQTKVLTLLAGGAAEFRSEFGKEAPIVEAGEWVENADGTVTVTLTDRAGAPLATPQELKFQREDTDLILVDYDESVWGEEGLRLSLAADVARQTRSALVTLDMSAGFALDPTFVSVNAGGEVAARLLSADCSGYIHRQPVATVNYGGGAEQARIFFYSDGDPTLVVMTPEGKLLCNDNASSQLLDPFVALDNPVAGEYRIWVGSADKNQLIPGVLVVTANTSVDLGTFKLGEFIARPSIPQEVVAPVEEATAGQQFQTFKDNLTQNAPALAPGFAPTTAPVTADGILPMFRLPDAADLGCGGLVTGAPSFAFKWAGSTPNLRVAFAGDSDTTLMVVGSNTGLALCNDDGQAGNPNPVINIENPEDDTYLVYVGRLDPEKTAQGELTVSEVAKEVTQ